MKGAIEIINKVGSPTDNHHQVKVTQFPAKTWPQVLTIFVASLAMVSAGSLFTWPSPTIPKLLTPEYNVTIEEASYLTVIPPISMAISTPIFCVLLDKIGRKRTLLTVGLFHMSSWLCIAFGSNIYIFYVSRAITGVADACGFASMPAYTAECLTPKIRGLYGNTMMIMMLIGQLLINCLGFYLPIQTAAFVMIIFPVLFMITFWFMPESPYYCLMKNDVEAARKSLYKLRRVKDIEAELKQLTSDVNRQMSEPSTYMDLWTIKSNRMAVIIANAARGFQQLGGISAFLVYFQYMFEGVGGNLSSGDASMIFTGMMTIAFIFANVVSDKLGRKKSMVISCFGCSILLLAEAIYFYLEEYTTVDVSVASWFPIVGLVLYLAVFAVGLGIVPMLLLGELFSTNIRSKAALTTNLSFAVYLSIINKLFQYLMTTYGLVAPFLFFTVCCFLSSIASYFLIPDTKGKTIEEIQQILKGNKQ